MSSAGEVITAIVILAATAAYIVWLVKRKL
jgi:hypothetical protein